MPIENRLDMELTGTKTPVGLKIQGPSLDGIEDLGARVQQILTAMPEKRSVFAERVAQGFYVNVEVALWRLLWSCQSGAMNGSLPFASLSDFLAANY
jgi:Cu/Ag efflux pump CusA